MMQSCKTSLVFLNPYIFLDGEIPNLMVPVHKLQQEGKAQRPIFDLGFGGVRGCAVSLTQNSKTRTPPHYPDSHTSNSRAAARKENHLVSLSMLRTTNFHVVNLTMVYFLNMNTISTVPYPQRQNKNPTFLILFEHFAAKSLFLATQKVFCQVPL